MITGKEWIVGGIAAIVALPLLILFVAMAFFAFGEYSHCRMLESVARDEEKQQYLVQLTNSWVDDTSYFASLEGFDGRFTSRQVPWDQNSRVKWQYLDKRILGKGVDFLDIDRKTDVKGRQIDAVQYIEASRAYGRNYIAVIVNPDFTAEDVAGEPLSRRITQINDRIFVYCEKDF